MRFSLNISDELYSKCDDLRIERGDSSISETIRYLISLGLGYLDREPDSQKAFEMIDERFDSFNGRLDLLEQSIRKENDAVLEKAVSKLEKSVGKVSSIQKQASNAAAASNGSLIAVITLMAHYHKLHLEEFEEWNPLSFEDRWKLFFSTGRTLSFTKDELVDFYHSFEGLPERVGNELATFADLYCNGDMELAEERMRVSDIEGFRYLGRHASKKD